MNAPSADSDTRANGKHRVVQNESTCREQYLDSQSQHGGKRNEAGESRFYPQVRTYSCWLIDTNAPPRSVVKAKNPGALGMEEGVAIVFRRILMISTADLRVACRREFPVMLESRNMEERVGPKKRLWILTIGLGVRGVPRSLDPNGEEVTQRLDGTIPCILADDLSKKTGSENLRDNFGGL